MTQNLFQQIPVFDDPRLQRAFVRALPAGADFGIPTPEERWKQNELRLAAVKSLAPRGVIVRAVDRQAFHKLLAGDPSPEEVIDFVRSQPVVEDEPPN